MEIDPFLLRVEGDIALLKRVDHPDTAPILTKPLKYDGQIHTHRGLYHHSEIIGKEARETVTSTNGRQVRIHRPTLEEYMIMTDRLVTPVYAREANLIVSLLDLHPSPPAAAEGQEPSKPLEILEAGTGHGALTLHLARAIHAANAHLHSCGTTPSEPPIPPHSAEESSIAGPGYDPRGAILHTLDISAKNSRHAQQIVQGFRNGLYTRDVDFHVDTIPSFLSQQTVVRSSSAPYLSHVILDLPAVHEQLADVSRALLSDGILLAFCPSITQIVACVRTAKRERLPLYLEQVIEVGAGMSAGRAWDVRLVRTRAGERQKNQEATAAETSAEREDPAGETSPLSGSKRAGDLENGSGDGGASGDGREHTASDMIDKWEVVCRPKLGDRVTAGGFLGLWRRRND